MTKIAREMKSDITCRKDLDAILADDMKTRSKRLRKNSIFKNNLRSEDGSLANCQSPDVF